MFSTRKNIKSQNLPPIGNVSRNVIPLGKNHPSASLDPFNNYLKAPDSTKMLCEHKSACDIESSLLISIFFSSLPKVQRDSTQELVCVISCPFALLLCNFDKVQPCPGLKSFLCLLNSPHVYCIYCVHQDASGCFRQDRSCFLYLTTCFSVPTQLGNHLFQYPKGLQVYFASQNYKVI